MSFGDPTDIFGERSFGTGGMDVSQATPVFSPTDLDGSILGQSNTDNAFGINDYSQGLGTPTGLASTAYRDPNSSNIGYINYNALGMVGAGSTLDGSATYPSNMDFAANMYADSGMIRSDAYPASGSIGMLASAVGIQTNPYQIITDLYVPWMDALDTPLGTLQDAWNGMRDGVANVFEAGLGGTAGTPLGNAIRATPNPDAQPSVLGTVGKDLIQGGASEIPVIGPQLAIGAASVEAALNGGNPNIAAGEAAATQYVSKNIP